MNKTDLIIRDMCEPGKASFIVGGQWGSEAKGCAAAWLAHEMAKRDYNPGIVSTNAGVQSGHTSIHKGKRRVSFHLPTAPFIFEDEGLPIPTVYLNGGSVIDPTIFLKEIEGFGGEVFIHPNASVIDAECVAAEMDAGSSQTKIASTRKGVGEAISRKVRRAAKLARDCPQLKEFVRRLDLNYYLGNGEHVLVEIPQGVSLSVDTDFYPHTTSRNCTPAQALSDAAIHPSFYGSSMVVLRTYPIRVGNINVGNMEMGNSGACYSDQKELSWEDLGVEAEITTVTKRIRRVFTFSKEQLRETFVLCRPDVVFLSFVNYIKDQSYLDEIESAIYNVSKELWFPPPRVVYEWGPTTDDIGEEYNVPSSVHGQASNSLPATIRRRETNGKLDQENIPGIS